MIGVSGSRDYPSHSFRQLILAEAIVYANNVAELLKLRNGAHRLMNKQGRPVSMVRRMEYFCFRISFVVFSHFSQLAAGWVVFCCYCYFLCFAFYLYPPQSQMLPHLFRPRSVLGIAVFFFFFTSYFAP